MKIQEDSLIPKYHQIKEILIHHIREKQLKDGDPLPSESELMREFSVSRNTVRQAFDLMERQGIAVKYQGKGTFYRNPRLNKAKRSGLIGLIAPMTKSSESAEILLETEEILYRNGYSLIFGCSSIAGTPKEQILLERMLKQNIDGLLFSPSSSLEDAGNAPFCRVLCNLPIPCVLLGAECSELTIPGLLAAQDCAGTEAAEILIKAIESAEKKRSSSA